MAKQKQTTFFPTSRRELMLTRYELLATAGGEKRSKLTVEMPNLAAQDFKGMPEWIANPFQEMAKEGSLTARTALEAMCEGMTMDLFETPKAKRRSQFSTGTMLTSFALVATGEGEKREISLTFAIYVPANIQLHQWAWDHIHYAFFADFEYSQTEMDFDGAEKDGEEESEAEPVAAASGDDEPPTVEEQDDDPDSAAQIAARARRPFNGRAVANAVN
jgi:hypothetical protein